MWKKVKKWFRHHKFNPVPCTCYPCELKKPLPEWATDYLRRKFEDLD